LNSLYGFTGTRHYQKGTKRMKNGDADEVHLEQERMMARTGV
jgi:hypothetical protein